LVVLFWGVAGLALLVAAVALSSARRAARKLDALTQSYWELRYDYTRLRSQVTHLASLAGADEESGAATPPPADPGVTFVPLSAMRKKDT
jgi:hypothetical protein